MNVIGKILKRLRISSLKYFMVFGKNKYLRRLVKVYKKYGIVFSGVCQLYKL